MSWFANSNYVYLQVMTTEKDSWYFSFPQDARQLTQHTCDPVSDGSSCAIAPVTQCNSLPVNSGPGDVSTQSIITAPSACSAGEASGNMSNGAALSYGLEVIALICMPW